MERVEALDPFQLSEPCWLYPVWPKLPLEQLPNMRPTREQILERDKERIKMAVKFVSEQQAPQRLGGRGVISGSQEYSDALKAIREIKPGQAIIVTMEAPELLKIKKPEVSFAYTVRRYLAKNGIMATAYQSGPKEVVIRKSETAGGSRGKKKGK